MTILLWIPMIVINLYCWTGIIISVSDFIKEYNKNQKRINFFKQCDQYELDRPAKVAYYAKLAKELKANSSADRKYDK